MKKHVGLTIEEELVEKLDELRGREKRSTFVEHLIKLGLKIYQEEEN